MKKIIKIILSMVLVIAFFSGCGNVASDEIMTAKEFKKNMENKGFTVADQTDSAADSTYQKIYVAVDDKKYSFEYYFMNSDKSADVVYQYAVTNLDETYKDMENAAILEEEKHNISDYSVSASDYYCRVLKKENTVLYVTAYHDSEDEAKSIIKELGYK